VTLSAGRGLIAVALLATICGASGAEEPSITGSVVDGARFFRDETILRADARIRDLRQRYHFDVRIETLDALPAAEAKQLESLWRQKSKGRYLDNLAREKAEQAGVDGLYILICRGPRRGFIQVTAYPDSARDVFSDFKRRELQDLLQKGLQGVVAGEGSNDAAEAALGFGWAARPVTGADAALLEGLSAIEKTVRERLGDPNAVRGWTVGALMVFGISVWLVLRIISRRMAARAPEAGLLGPTQPDRTPGLLAAQFGSPAAYWIYDRLFYGPPPAAAAKLAAEEIIPPAPNPREAIASDLIHPEPETDHADAAAPDGPA
jgi:hypothetical protein